jgi:hypothetical protein
MKMPHARARQMALKALYIIRSLADKPNDIYQQNKTPRQGSRRGVQVEEGSRGTEECATHRQTCLPLPTKIQADWIYFKST